jgi:hypothetical protein
MIHRKSYYNWMTAFLIMFFFISGFTLLSCYSQNRKTINVAEIPQKNICTYIESRAIDQMQDFSLIHASWNKESKVSDFHSNKETFYLKNSRSDVWNYYSHTNLIKTWKGHHVTFGLEITKSSNSVVYIHSLEYPVIDTGQVYFLNLSLLKGLVHIPVAFEIINIDAAEEILEFSYLEDNKSRGKQIVQFFDNGDGRTRIVHTSYFKSNSWIRDYLLYPFFHKRFIREFHRNMGNLVKKI